MNLDGKTILVTGSTDGVGRRVALHLAGSGAEVLAHGRSRERGESLLAEMRAKGDDRGRFYRADFASLAEVRGLAEAVAKDHPRLSVLINMPASAAPGPVGAGARQAATGMSCVSPSTTLRGSC